MKIMGNTPTRWIYKSRQDNARLHIKMTENVKLSGKEKLR